MKGGLLLLGLLVVAHYAPAFMSWALGGTVAAWDYVTQGAQAAALWSLVASGAGHVLARGVCALGVFESMQRPICRAMFPMDRSPQTGGQNLCDAALGVPVTLVNALAALFVALVAQEMHRASK
jgi:hypothetical protein